MGAEADATFDQILLFGESEHDACQPDPIGCCLNSHTLHQLGLEKPEGMGIHIFNQTGFPEGLSDQRADAKVIVPASLGQFSGLHLPVLGREEGIHQEIDVENAFRLFWLFRLRSVAAQEVVFQSFMMASPALAEVVDFACDSLVPVSSFVPVERELWIRFFSVFLVHQHPRFGCKARNLSDKARNIEPKCGRRQRFFKRFFTRGCSSIG